MHPGRWLAIDAAALVVILGAIGYRTDLFDTGPAASCEGVDVSPGSSIQEAIDSHGTGTTLCLSGDYTTSKPITPKDGDRFIGTGTTNISSTGSGVFSGGKHVTYDNLGIGPSQGDGLRPGDRSTIKNSTIHDNVKCGITTVGNSLVITGNDVSQNGSPSTSPISQACGIKIHGYRGADSGAYSTISGNVVHDNVHTALWVDCNGHDNVFSGNMVYGNTGVAVSFETSYRNTFRGNTVHDNGFEMKKAAVSILDSLDSVVRRNTFTNNYRGLLIWADRRATLSSPQVGTGCAGTSLAGYIPSHISVRGNKFTTEDRVGLASSVQVSAASFDRNCYRVATESDANWQLPGDSTATWTQWRRAGKDPNGIRTTTGC
jgi:parallel beta-helix repeat protein